MTDRLKGAMAVAAAATLWGTWGLWLQGPALDACTQAGVVLVIAGVLASAIALAARPRWSDVPARAWALLVLFSLLDAGNYTFFFRAISEGDLSTAVVTNYLSPLFVALASPLLREPLGRRTPLAALVAFVATGALVGIGQTGPGTRLAALEGGTSAIFFASGMLVARRLTPFLGPWALVGFHDLLAAPVVWLGARTPVTSASRDELLRLAFGAVLSGTFAAGLYFYGLARIPAARTAVIAYVEPVSASLIGVFVLHQEMTVVKVVAIAVILGAGLAVATEKMPREPRSVSEPEGHAAV